MTTHVDRVRLDCVDKAKAFSIILVVLAHVANELTFIDASPDWLDWVVRETRSFRMPLFFCAAGLFAVKWLQSSWQKLLSGKVAVLLWVFIIWQPVVFIYKVLEMELLPNQPENSWTGQLMKLVLSPVRPNGELWFLWALCVFFILAKLMVNLPTWARVGVPAVVSFAWFSFSDSLLPAELLRTLGNGADGVTRYFIFFVIGTVFASSLVRVFSSLSWYGGLGIFAAWAGVVWATDSANSTLLGFPLAFLGIAGGFGLAVALSRVRMLDRIGRNTLPIYVAHLVLIVLAVCSIQAAGMTPLARAHSSAVAVAIFVIAVGGAWGLHSVLIRNRIGRYLYTNPQWFTLVSSNHYPSGPRRSTHLPTS